MRNVIEAAERVEDAPGSLFVPEDARIFETAITGLVPIAVGAAMSEPTHIRVVSPKNSDVDALVGIRRNAVR